jgi:hypothetical protein
MILHRDTFGQSRLQLDFRSAQSGYICNTAVLTCAEEDGLGLLGETFVERECLLEQSSALHGSIVLQGRPPIRIRISRVSTSPARLRFHAHSPANDQHSGGRSTLRRMV